MSSGRFTLILLTTHGRGCGWRSSVKLIRVRNIEMGQSVGVGAVRLASARIIPGAMWDTCFTKMWQQVRDKVYNGTPFGMPVKMSHISTRMTILLFGEFPVWPCRVGFHNLIRRRSGGRLHRFRVTFRLQGCAFPRFHPPFSLLQVDLTGRD